MASAVVFQRSWGFAPLHPRLYAIATLRGLKTKTLYQLVQSFLEYIISQIRAFAYGVAGFAVPAGLLNFASSTGALSFISVYLRVETKPGSTDETFTVNGTFTPSTSR